MANPFAPLGRGGSSATSGVSPDNPFFSLRNEEAYARKKAASDRKKKRQRSIEQGLNRGMSWEQISQDTGIPLQSVKNYSQRTRPDYGIDKRNLGQKLVGNVKENVSSALDFGGAVESVIQDVTGGTARKTAQQEALQQKLIRRKREIRESSVLSPETKKDLLGKINELEKRNYATTTDARSRQLGELQRTQEEPIIKGGATFGAGIERSLTGAAQGISGLADLATPGEGQSRATQFLNRGAEATDQLVEDNQMNDLVYKGGQLSGEALQFLVGGQLARGGQAIAKGGRVFKLGQNVTEATRAAQVLEKAGIVGKIVKTTGGYVLQPARVANVAGNVAVDQGQLSARGEDISPKSIGISTLANYTLGGILEAGSGALGKLSKRRAQAAKDVLEQANTARINQEMSNIPEDILPREIKVKQIGGKSVGKTSQLTPQAYEKATAALTKKYEAEMAQAAQKGPLARQKAMDAVDAKYSAMQDTLDNLVDTTKIKFKDSRVRGSSTVAETVGNPSVSRAVGGNAPQGDLPDLTPAQGGDYGVSTPKAAQRLEADAIQADIVRKGQLELPQTANINMEDQVSKAVNLMNDDWNKAVDVAMGNTSTGTNLQSSVVYEAVKRRAIESGDKTLIYQLSKSDVPTQGKAAGQFIKGFDTKDPTDPVEAIRQILKAKKESKLPNINQDLTPEELGRITDLADAVQNRRGAIPDGSPDFSPERVLYGQALVDMRRYKNELIDATKTKYQKFAPRGFLTATAGTAKSLKAALDNSFFGRQGLKVLTSHPTIWGKAFLKSWGDMAKGVKGIDALDALDAMNLSRVNAMNGKYKAMGLDLHTVEEAFPSSLPEKVPVLGRLFKASEYAYTGGAHRMRADLADMMLEKAQKAGVDINDKAQLESMGKLINSMTGRGDLGKSEKAADFLNNLFFSPRNWKSNLDFLTAHQLQKGVTPFVRKEAAKNLAKMIGTVGAVAAVSNAIYPGSWEKDPRSSNFGKLKFGNTRFDITGGNAGIATLISRLIPDPKKALEGDLKWYTKSSTTGFTTELNSDAYGARSVWDVLLDYGEGKLSPTSQAVKQLLTQEQFTGEPVTPQSFFKDLFAPLPYTNYQELRKDPNSANDIIASLSDMLGVGTNTYSGNKDWNMSTGAILKQFKSSVSKEDFTKANEEYNTRFNDWVNTVKDDPEFRKYSEKDRNNLINAKSRKLTNDILESYDFDYKRKKKTSKEKKTSDRLLSL